MKRDVVGPDAQVDERDEEERLMMHWLKDCLENHEACRNNQRGYSTTRLLDVDQYRSSGDIVLVETEAHPLPYTTLSHCWGPPSKGPLTTTLENLPYRLDRINFNELPQTFKDAVNTTRRLGIPYLWIDSLCIIQDSPDDWAKEASRMADVYAGALCTLAAVSSQDSRGGFFRISEKKMEFVFRYDLNLGDKRIRVFPGEPNSWSISGLLMNRAWTLQERNLSNRILYFKRGDLLWECATMKASADIPFLPVSKYLACCLTPSHIESRVEAYYGSLPLWLQYNLNTSRLRQTNFRIGNSIERTIAILILYYSTTMQENAWIRKNLRSVLGKAGLIP
ncbi:MAG: hypothetical protein Q9180_002850 [Flavoplaca navasiana]